ncbi:MAG: 2-oxoacid:acceptor oxidoreductase family protein [Planctomycetota bacterium]
MNNRLEIRLAGIGGQGVVYAAELLGRTAALKHHVAVSASYGPESRGSLTKSEVVISDHPIDYPQSESPNILVAMHQVGYDAWADKTSREGTIIIDSYLVKPHFSHDKIVVFHHSLLPALQIARDEIKNAGLANLIITGFTARTSRIISLDELILAFKEMSSAPEFERGKKALEIGFNYNG